MMEETGSTETPMGATKPCIALMGEFSAGKSTLSNLLIGAQALPVQVTATQLPPVWIAHGDQEPYRVDHNGDVHPVDLNRIDDISVDDTDYVRIYRKSEILESADIIDMPGISDPSMAASVWQRVIHHANSVIWCTHATQAWRQSEAAVWDSLPTELYEKSILLLTRMDKITSERDRVRLLRRVMHETQGLFAEVLPISLLQAVEAGEDKEAWRASGADVFSNKLLDIVHGIDGAPERPKTARPDTEVVDEFGSGASAANPASPSVMPTRVTPRVGVRPSTRRRERPATQTAHVG